MINLDESLFDDDFTMLAEDIDDVSLDDYDDSLFDYEPIARAEALTDHNGEAVPEGPNPGIESGIADALINLINDEWEAIQGYNDFRAMIQQMHEAGDGDYTASLAVIDEIVNEENLHVGQLQTLLKQVSPNAASIDKGEQEGDEQLERVQASSGNEWVNGKLKVEAHTPISAATKELNVDNSDLEICSLCDIDDEW